MAEIHERVELVVAGLLLSHPALRSGDACVAEGILQVGILAGGPEQFRRAPFHVIGPGGLLVSVGGAVGIALLHTLSGAAHGVNFPSCFEALPRKDGLVRVILPDLEGKAHGRCVASGKVRDACGFALILAQSLRLSIRKIHHPRSAFPPTVIRDLVLGQALADVVAVIGHLMVELVGCGMHLEQPEQTPAGLIKNIRHSVRTRLAEPVAAILKRNMPLPQLPGEQELSCGISGGDHVFEQIGCIVPSAGGVDGCAVGQGAVGGAAILQVAIGLQPGVVAAALLAHEFKQLVRQAAVNVLANLKRKGLCPSDPQCVSPWLAKAGEIHHQMLGETAPGHRHKKTLA